jgi:osmotically-inducible protein OsmY
MVSRLIQHTMKSNEALQRDVQDAIKWEPLLNAAEIGVTAKDGIVTLTGTVNTYAKKLQAEDAVKKTAGVKALVENLQVHFDCETKKSDSEIATEVLNALRWNWEVSNDKMTVKVEDGWVTLEGELQWNFQKEAAKNSVNNLKCIKGITNNITIKTDKNDLIEKKDIERALEVNWSINERNIIVTVEGSNVRLSGSVESLYEKDEAGRIAWNAPGVWTVENNLVIDYNV